MNRILIVAAHPDDEILGCGATVARLIKEGYEAYTLILGEGIISRDLNRDIDKSKEDIEELKKQMQLANDIIGVKKVFTYDFPDNRFDTVPFLDIVKMIEKVKNKIKPDIIFTHYEKDLNIDHQITYKAVLTATRPMTNETVKEIYSFEILSSTEWNYPLTFSPSVFFDISETIEIKQKAMNEYKSELREYPHPRSLEGIKMNAANWGMRMGVKFAEIFMCIRQIR